MKLWFIEPRPNIFVSGIKDSVAKEVIEYLYGHCPPESGLMVFMATPKTPGYKIMGMGEISRKIFEISGLQLVVEKQQNSDKAAGTLYGASEEMT
ncbi:MAG: type I-E CRISPR-associated endoribonuclease Cas2e [Acidithiobacillus ferrivorans]